MPTDRPPRILFLAAIAALTSLGVDMCLPAIPSIESGLGGRSGHGVLASSLFMAGFALTPLFGGPLSDSLGRVRVVLLSLGSFALAALGCALAPSMTIFLVLRFLQGCASGMATTLPLAVVGDCCTGSPARQRMSEISTLSSFMPILAPVLGTIALHAGGWRLLFGLETLYGGLLAAIAFSLPETLPTVRRQPLRLAQVLSNCAALLMQPRLRNLGLVYGLAFASTFCFTAVSPLVLIERMGLARSTYTLILALNAVGSILGAAVSAWLNHRRISPHHIVLSGLGLMLTANFCGFFFQFRSPALPAALLPAAFLALFGFNLAGPSLLVEALRAAPHLLGTGSGILRSIFTALNFATSAILGVFCAQHFDLTEKAAACSMAALAGMAGCLFLATGLRGVCHENSDRMEATFRHPAAPEPSPPPANARHNNAEPRTKRP